MTTLDDLVGRVGVHGRIGLKIDTEGAEMEVLRGGAGTLQRCSFVILELSIAPRFHGSYDFSEAVDHMSRQGFVATAVLAARPATSGEVPHVDLLFTPRRSP